MTKPIPRAALAAEYRKMIEGLADAKGSDLDVAYRGLVEMGVTLPGWAKKTVAEKREVLMSLVPPPEHKGQTKSATMPKDPKWQRRTMKAWQIPFASARRPARRAQA